MINHQFKLKTNFYCNLLLGLPVILIIFGMVRIVLLKYFISPEYFIDRYLITHQVQLFIFGLLGLYYILYYMYQFSQKSISIQGLMDNNSLIFWDDIKFVYKSRFEIELHTDFCVHIINLFFISNQQELLDYIFNSLPANVLNRECLLRIL